MLRSLQDEWAAQVADCGDLVTSATVLTETHGNMEAAVVTTVPGATPLHVRFDAQGFTVVADGPDHCDRGPYATLLAAVTATSGGATAFADLLASALENVVKGE